MIETFTKKSTVTSNGIEMEHHNQSENLGEEDLSFYDSLTGSLDSIQMNPKDETLQNILHYSKNFSE
jgi:hypothetical protein